ncbi:unnamed protein product [Urochloa humidicola]
MRLAWPGSGAASILGGARAPPTPAPTREIWWCSSIDWTVVLYWDGGSDGSLRTLETSKEKVTLQASLRSCSS